MKKRGGETKRVGERKETERRSRERVCVRVKETNKMNG